MPRRSKWRVVTAAGLALIAVGWSTVPAAAAKKPPVPKPPEWSERALPLVHFVERNRGLEFDHPVEVRLVPAEKFDRRNSLSGADFFLRQLLAQLKALGLVSADDGVADQLQGMVLGYFDPFRQVIVVRGDDLTDPLTRVILVHELAHALVSQEFRRFDRSDVAGTFGWLALSEGDATAVEHDYVARLPARDREVVGDALAELGLDVHPIPVLSVVGLAQYELGASYVELLDALGQRDDAFRHPPSSDVEIIDPLRARPGRLVLERLPRLAEGEEWRGQGAELGQMLVYLMLATHLDAKTSLDAALGWGADRFRMFRREGVPCVHLGVRGVTDTETATLAAAFAQWATARPLGAATVVMRDEDVLVTTCAAGGPVQPVSDFADDVRVVLGGRLVWSAEAVRAGDSKAVALCVGDAMALDPQVLAAERDAVAAGRPVGHLDDTAVDALGARFEEVRASCRSARR